MPYLATLSGLGRRSGLGLATGLDEPIRYYGGRRPTTPVRTYERDEVRRPVVVVRPDAPVIVEADPPIVVDTVVAPVIPVTQPANQTLPEFEAVAPVQADMMPTFVDTALETDRPWLKYGLLAVGAYIAYKTFIDTKG